VWARLTKHATVNDAEFRQAERDWHSFVDKLTAELIEIDDTVPELPVKDVVSLLVILFLQRQRQTLW
jgi:hypothetical protein